MKQTNYLKRVQGMLFLLMLAFAAPLLTACGSDDDEPAAPQPIVGLREATKMEYYDNSTGEYYEMSLTKRYERYSQDGTLELLKTISPDELTTRGTWQVARNELTVKTKYPRDVEPHEFVSILTITGDVMVHIGKLVKNRITYKRLKE